MTGFDLPRSACRTQLPAQRNDVYIEVRAQPAQLVPVRVVAAALAARADFDLDAVADLKIAVDEACATLATLAPPQAKLQCLLQVDLDQIIVSVWVSTRVLFAIPQDTFGWRILMTLVDVVEVLGDGRGPGIRMIKMRRMGRA